jgi:predicted HNH restriction endonuclease
MAKGWKMTEEQRKRVSEAHKGQKAWNKGLRSISEKARKQKNKEYREKYYKKNRERIRAREKQHYEENKERISTHRKERYHKLKEDFLLTYKKGKKCVICGWNKHPEILQFHHKDRTKKMFTIGNIKVTERTTPKNRELVKKEIDKCLLLCPNCHALLHLKKRVKK